jgi:hypothetical protein
MNAKRGGPQLVVLATVSALFLLGACGPFSGQSTATPNPSERAQQTSEASPATSADTQPQPAESGSPVDQGGQNTPTGYTDARYHYRITGPGPLKARPDGTASFVGEDERLEVVVVEGDQAANPLGLAQSEISSLSSTSANFRTIFGPANVTLGGQNMIKVSYAWTGKSQATGTQLKKTGVRYYIAKNPTMLAAVRYEDASGEFDQQEADGFAGSFRWL